MINLKNSYLGRNSCKGRKVIKSSSKANDYGRYLATRISTFIYEGIWISELVSLPLFFFKDGYFPDFADMDSEGKSPEKVRLTW